MHRLPLTDLPLVAALATLGHTIEPPKAYSAAGKEHTTFFITGGVGEAGTLVETWRAGRLPAAHPLFACLHGIEALASLHTWLAQPQASVRAVTTDGTLLRFAVNPAGALSLVNAGAEAGTLTLFPPAELLRHDDHHAAAALQGRPFPLLPHHFAAAAIVCGCVPVSGLTGSALRPEIHLSAASVTIPGLTLPLLAAAFGPRSGLALPELPGAPAGEHPFEYALEAIRHHCGLRFAGDLARTNPVLLFRSKLPHSPKTALISKALLLSKATLPDASGRRVTAEEQLARHLAS